MLPLPFLDLYNVLKKVKEFPEALYSLVCTVASTSFLGIFKLDKLVVFLKLSKRSANAYSIRRLQIPTSLSLLPIHSSLCLVVDSAPSSSTSTPPSFRKATRNSSTLPSVLPKVKKVIKKLRFTTTKHLFASISDLRRPIGDCLSITVSVAVRPAQLLQRPKHSSVLVEAVSL